MIGAKARLIWIAASMMPAGLASAQGSATTQALAARGPTILAAADMRTALDAIAAAWTARGGKPPVVSYASAADFAGRIAAGPAADILIAADPGMMDDFARTKFIDPRTRQSIVGDDLVLVERADGRTVLKIASGFDLAGALGDGTLALCPVPICPVGLHGREALETLKVWAAVEPKLAPAADERASLHLVANGEARFGIVTASVAKAEPGVRVVDAFPASTHKPIIYPIALAREAKSPDAAAFEAFMRSAQATRILNGQAFKIFR